MPSTVWRGYISFGLISIPVRLFRAARAERISFRRVYRQSAPESEIEQEERVAPPAKGAPALAPALAGKPGPVPASEKITSANTQRATEPPVLMPLRQVSVRPETNEHVPEQQVVKGYEYEKNRYVAIEPEELKSVAPATSGTMEIEEFVQLAEIDPVYFETSYYLVPEEAGEKAYTLLYKAMQTSGLVAIARFAMHSREHVVVLRPGKHGLLAHTMFFANEVRADEEYHADLSVVSDKELKLAETLIHSLAAPFEPEKYRDTYREKIQALIDRKLKGLPVSTAPAAAQRADVIDIAEALRKSLANLKKPVASAAKQAAPAARKSRKASAAKS